MRLRFERYFSHHQPDDGRSISRNVASLNILVHDVINLLYKGIFVLHFCEKVKDSFFGSLNETILCDNEKFWGEVKPLLSNKVVYNERITLVEDDKIIENDKNTASILNGFSSNIVTTLAIPQYNEKEPVSHNIGDSLMKAIMKYSFHPGTVAIKKNCKSDLFFSFSQVERDEVMKEINNLKTNKATQSTNIPTKLIKESSDIFGDFIFGNYNNCASYSFFPNSFKKLIITPVHKEGAKTSKDNYRPVSILSNISKLCESLIFNKYQNILNLSYQNFNMVFEKGTVFNTAY